MTIIIGSNSTGTGSEVIECNNHLSANFLADPFATIGPRVSGSISVLSSATIIYLIFRSDYKLSTIYHRIMFGMSMADVIGSTAMALTTIPMPRDLSMYNFHEFAEACWLGLRLGNLRTCEAQGFLVILGSLTMYAYNVALCLYYMFAMAFRMKNDHIKRKIEPALHLASVAVPLTLALPPLLRHHLNPIGSDPWCAVAEDNGRGAVTPEQSKSFMFMYGVSLYIYMGLIYLLIISSFVVIMVKVKQMDRLMRAHSNTSRNRNRNRSNNRNRSDNTNDIDNSNSNIDGGLRRRGRVFDNIEESYYNVKILFLQMLAYVLALMVTTVSCFPRLVSLDELSITISIQVVFFPLQGFFNAIIFIAHKVYNFHRIHPDESACKIILKLFSGKANDEVLVTRISLISGDQEDEAQAGNQQITNQSNKSRNYDLSTDISKLNNISSAEGRSGSFELRGVKRDALSSREALSGFFSNNSTISSNHNLRAHDDREFNVSTQGSLSQNNDNVESETGLSYASGSTRSKKSVLSDNVLSIVEEDIFDDDYIDGSSSKSRSDGNENV